MKLRKYQTTILEGIGKSLKKNKKTVLAATTGSGKTEIIIKFIKEHSDKRFLILTHGQRTIKQNFASRLQLRKVKHTSIVSSADLPGSNKDNVVVALPQNIHKYVSKLNKFDYLVVDEAHQFYGEEKRMYGKILEWHKGKQILITATHYNLDGEKVYFSKEQALQAKMLMDTDVDLIGVKENLDDDSFTAAGELRETEDLTEHSYKKVLSVVDGSVNTLVITHNTNFASKMARKLRAKGIDAEVSDCYTDVDSDELTAFKAGRRKVLVVVMRGNIGFDYPNLQHIVDVSYTKNLSRIEQLMGRLSRKSTDKTIKTKTYTKIIPDNMFPQYLIYITGVLSLGVDEIYRTWEGRQADLAIKLPSDGLLTAKAAIDTISVGAWKVNSHYRTSFSQYVNLWRGEGTSLSTSVGAALSAITTGADPEGKKRQILEMAKNGEDRPTKRKHPLGMVLSHYTKQSGDCYDPTFREELEALRPDWINPTASKKALLLEMAKNGEDRPARRKHPLGGVLTDYTSQSSHSYDPAFREELEHLAPHWFKSLLFSKKT